MPETLSNKIIEIGGQPLSANELTHRMQQYQLWPQFVREWVIDQAIAPQHCSIEDVQQACAAVFTQNNVPADKQDVWLQTRGMSYAMLELQMSRQIRLQRFKQNTWGHQLESIFLKQKGRLDRVTYSVIRSQDKDLAQELYCRLLEKEADFADLARDYSAGRAASNGGRIGPIALTAMPPQIARILQVSQPGQLWPPQKRDDWYLLLRLEERHPARLDEPTRARLLDELFEERIHQQMAQTPLRVLPSFPTAA